MLTNLIPSSGSSRACLMTFAFGVLLLGGCGGGGSGGSGSEGEVGNQSYSSPLRLPDGFPAIRVPADNPYSEEKAELGRLLFYDKRLSRNQSMSCGSCHLQSRAFSDGLGLAVGSTGQAHPRNSQSLVNLAYNVTFNWSNPLIDSAEKQLLLPLFNSEPVELGFAGHEDELISRISEDPAYQESFARVFPGEGITLANMAKAIGTFERKFISGNSPYDQYVYQGKDQAISESAKRGLELFFSERLECDHCHGGFNFSSATTHAGETFLTSAQFANNGLYNLNGNGNYPLNNRGLIEFTGKKEDMGKFKPPSLRNIEMTAPYMHDGSIGTLEEVIAHYARGGRAISSGAYAGDGSKSPYKNGLLQGFSLTSQETLDLLEFLRSLTDQGYLTREDLSDPYQ